MFGQTLRIAKQHWVMFFIFALMILGLSFGTIFIVAGAGIGAIMSGNEAGMIAIGIIGTLLFVALSIIISISILKVVHLTATNQEVKIGEVFSYAFKHFFSFIWAGIAGTIYALRWALIIIIGVPVVWAIANVLMTQSLINEIPSETSVSYDEFIEYVPVTSASSAMYGVVRIILSLLALVGLAFMMIAFIRIIFLGYAFVADEKRGLEAAKASMELVKGRWWKTFGYFLLTSILLGMVVSIIGYIIALVGDNAIGGIVNGIVAQFGSIIVVIFSAVLYGAYKKDPR